MRSSFNYSSSGIDTSKSNGNYEPIPPGEYWLEIVDFTPKETGAGDPMLNVEFEVRDDRYSGRKVWNNVVFFRDKQNKGAGICLHFLHCIGEPYEGDFKVDPDNWIGKKVKAKLVIEEYEVSEGGVKVRKTKNAVKFFVLPLYETTAKKNGEPPLSDEDVPF